MRVELLRRVANPGGGLWHPGEVVAFEPSVARRLVAQGAAREVSAGRPVSEAPPAHKMVTAAGAARKAARRPAQ